MSGSALSNIRVVEVGTGFAAAYTAKLLADLGADVVKVEAPGGDLTRDLGPFPSGRPDRETSGLYLYLNTNKRGVVLDLAVPGDRRTFDKLVDRADVLVHDFEPAR